jgi:hypothetical protein
MRAFFLGVTIVSVSAGCGASAHRRDFLGRRPAAITSGAPDDAMPAVTPGGPGSATVSVKDGDQIEIAWTIAQPHAEKLRYAIACPGAATEPIFAGETMDEYRARRIAELRAQAEKDRQRVAAVTGMVAGAVAPRVSGQVETPTGNADVEAGVDGQAVGNAVAASTVSTDVALPPGDVGAGTLRGTTRLSIAGDGTCGMTVFTDTPGVAGSFSVTRIVDVRAEREAHAAVRREAAIDVRGRLTGTLIAAGADPEAQQRARDAAMAEARAREDARAAADAQAALDLQVKADLEARARLDAQTGAFDFRASYVKYLVGECHADPDKRQRERDEEARRVQVAAELETRRLRIAIDLRARLRSHLIARGADPDLRARLAAEARARAAEADARARAAEAARAEADARAAAEAAAIVAAAEAREATAREVREQMMGVLIAMGARLRPPMPPPMPESPGDRPFDGAIWVAGSWTWVGAEWQWTAGGWSDSGTFTRERDVDNVVRDHRSEPTDVVRDHRGGGSGPGVTTYDNSDSTTSGTVRDHRSDRRDDAPPPRNTNTVVRDHRSNDDDKRDKDKKEDDDKKDVVRDHRRR